MIEPREVERHRRQIRAMVGAANDPEAFAAIVALHAELADLLVEQANVLRESDGFSWADLARPLGVTRAAVQQRFGRRRRRPQVDEAGAEQVAPNPAQVGIPRAPGGRGTRAGRAGRS